MASVFFIIWQCLQANEVDIYDVLGDAPKQRSLGVDHSSTAKEPHYSKFHSCFFSVIKEIFQVQSFRFGVWVLFILHAQNTTSQATSSQGALCSLHFTINNLFRRLPLLGCPLWKCHHNPSSLPPSVSGSLFLAPWVFNSLRSSSHHIFF